MGDDRTPDMALLPGERAMTEAEWAEYGGLPPTLKAYCHQLLIQEAEARRLQRLDALEVVEWRHRAMRVMDRLGASEQRAESAERRLRITAALIIEAIGSVGPEDAEDAARRLGDVSVERDAATARAEAAEQRAEALAAELKRTKMAMATAYTDLPVWSEGALAHLSPAERAADQVRAALGQFMQAEADRKGTAEAQPAGEVSDG